MYIVTSNEINIITFVLAVLIAIFLMKLYKSLIIRITLRKFKVAKAENDKKTMADLLLVLKNKNLLTRSTMKIVDLEVETMNSNDN